MTDNTEKWLDTSPTRCDICEAIITDEFVDAYCELHELGFAHCVEVWCEEDKVWNRAIACKTHERALQFYEELILIIARAALR